MSKIKFIALLITLLAFAGTATFAQTKPRKKIRKPSPTSTRKPAKVDADRDAKRGYSRTSAGSRGTEGDDSRATKLYVPGPGQPRKVATPRDTVLKRAGSFNGDVRTLKYRKPVIMELPERDEPDGEDAEGDSESVADSLVDKSLPTAAAPSPSANFVGLDLATWGSGYPPDTNGDVGPTYFIQSVNSSVGIYRKSDGVRVAAFTLNTLMSQGAFGNLCDNTNRGDPVVLYDTFEDRWIITDFAFTNDASGNITSNSYECFAVSKTGDPVGGGWNFYSTVDTDFFGDYPKLGVWTDGIYMSANMFGKSASGGFSNVRLRALNKAQMYAGAPTVQVVVFDAPAGDFSIMPSNARLQTGTPPAGTPNLMTVLQFTNALSVYKLKVDWQRTALSTLTGPFVAGTGATFSSAPSSVPTLGGNNIQTLTSRLMMQNQYTNIGGVESLWNSHSVTGSAAGLAGVRVYQLNVTGGTIASTTTQAFTHSPDATIHRFMPSVAVNRVGDMAALYSASSSTMLPAIRYAGRLASDPVNTMPQSETSLIEGTGTQTNNCGGAACTRWGDYATMTLDPDGCTYWMTTEYYATNGGNWQTRIGSFAFPGCVTLANNGGVSGTVTSAATGLPVDGATVKLGNRTATTNSSGVYTFNGLPAGNYPSIGAEATGYNASATTTVTVADGTTANRDFTLSTSTSAACLTDTTKSDFQTGETSNLDLDSSNGDAKLLITDNLDAQHTTGTTTGTSLATTLWGGQTFTAVASGLLTKVDMQLFCSGCTGTTPALNVSIRATSGGIPTGPNLATATLNGFSSGAGTYYRVNFAAAANVTAGTQYALVVAPSAAPSVGGYFWIRASPDAYAGGQRVISTDNGATWSADATRDFNFRTYIQAGYSSPATLTSAVKDSNPVAAGTTVWQSIAWTDSKPANTDVKFQVAASNNVNGPFNFVGPDNTSGTFFTNGGSLSQFNGLRYLKYKAVLSTTNSAATPTLSDVTICFSNPRVWTGAVSSDWNNPANWAAGGVPTSTDVAVVPTAGVTNNPQNTTSTTIASLTLGSGRIVDTGTNTLTVSSCLPGAISGAGPTSYVKGTLVRCVNNTGSFVFPVGDSSGYTPVTLSNVAGTGNFTVNSSGTLLPGADSSKSVARNWLLSPDPGVTQADVTLSYLDVDVPVGANEGAFQFLRRSGASTTTFAPSSSDPVANTFTLNGVNAFSTWSLGVLVATAGEVSVSGRVKSASGVPVLKATVTIRSLATGETKTLRTGRGGAFRFDGLTAGGSYVLTANGRGVSTSSVIDVIDNVTGVELVLGGN